MSTAEAILISTSPAWVIAAIVLAILWRDYKRDRERDS